MSRQYVYNPEEGEFVDFSTLEDWERRDKEKDERIKKLEEEIKDNSAIDEFAALMKEKMKRSREKGRYGWSSQLRRMNFFRICFMNTLLRLMAIKPAAMPLMSLSWR